SKIYYFSVEVSDIDQNGNTKYTSHSNCTVHVVPSLPVAKIEGGNFRKLSVVSTLELDGTSSYDPDSENGNPSNAIYDWSCCELINGVCDFVIGNMKFPN